MIRKLGLIGAIGALALAVAGCDDDSGPSAALSGTAAVGAPIMNTAVTIKCSGATADIVEDTNDVGVYSVSRADMQNVGAELPCALQITSGGVTLFSLVTDGSRANITPLTNLVVAKAIVDSGAAADAAAWFTAGASFTSVTQTDIDDAIDAVEVALQTATSESDVPFDIFTTNFKADAKSTYDVWLESLKTQLTTGGANYATAYNALVVSYASGGTIPVFTITIPDTSGGTGGGMGNLKVTVTSPYLPAGGQELMNVLNVPIPASKAEFCDDAEFKDLTTSYPGTWTCSFSGTTGKYTSSIGGVVITFAWTRV